MEINGPAARVQPSGSNGEKPKYPSLASPPVGSKAIIKSLFPGWWYEEEMKPIGQDEYDALFLVWPPNMFAFTSLFFQLSGSYSQLTSLNLDERFERVGTYTLTYGGSYQVKAKDPRLPRAR